MNSAVVSTAPHFLPHQGSPCGSPQRLSLLKMRNTGAGKEAGFGLPCPWGWGGAIAVQIPPLTPEFWCSEQGRHVYIKATGSNSPETLPESWFPGPAPQPAGTQLRPRPCWGLFLLAGDPGLGSH